MSDQLRDYIDKKLDGEPVSIVNMDGGCAIELVDIGLQDVLRNIADINMKLKVKRQVVLTVNVNVMDENRSLVHIDYDVKTKLAERIPLSEGETYELKVSTSNGVYAKSRRQQEQAGIFDNVKPMKGGK